MKISNVSIVVDKIQYKKNHLQKGNYPLNPKLARETGQTLDGNHFTKIFLKIDGSTDSNFPMDLDIEMTAIFQLDDIKEQDNVKQFLALQGVHILYPYLRSTVASITTSAMVNPITLPIINAMTLFEHPKTQEKNSQH